MSQKDSTSRRRTVLRAVAASASIGSIGIVSGEGQSQEAGSEDNRELTRGLSGRNSRETELTFKNSSPKESYLALKKERQERLSENGDGRHLTYSPIGDKEHLEYVDHWEHEYDVEDWGTIAETDHTMTLLEVVDDNGNRVTDNDGRYVYVFEHYSKSDGVHHWWAGDPKTTYIDSHLDISNNAVELAGRDPKTTETIDGAYVSIGINGSAGPIGFGISGETYVDNGQIGPGEYSPGGAGEYSVRFSGCSEKEVTDILGYSELRSSVLIPDLESEIGLNWATEVEAQTTNTGPC